MIAATSSYMYEEGNGGLPKDLSEAIAWYRKAAAQGNERAISRIQALGG